MTGVKWIRIDSSGTTYVTPHKRLMMTIILKKV